MASNIPNPSAEDIARQLTEQARALWGKQRAALLQESLAQTARMLLELRRNLPDRNIEPGFYP